MYAYANGFQISVKNDQSEVLLHFTQSSPVFSRGDNSITEQYIERSVTENWDLKELLVERCSLDRIFAQLSGKIKE